MFWRYRVPILICVILLTLSFGVYFTRPDVRSLSSVEKWFRDTLEPVQAPFIKISTSYDRTVKRIENLRRLESDNKRLLDRLAYLESTNQSLEEERRENIRLRSLLDLKSSIPQQTVAARVVSRDPSRWFNTLLLDVGSTQGIKPDMPVLAPGGLVGRISTVSRHTSTVLLILDSRSAVSALVRRTRDIVIAEGNSERPGRVVAKPLNARLVGDTEQWTSQVKIRVGDVIVSSGLGGVFPKGLAIGRVAAIGQGRYGVSKNAIVEPFVDFSRLEEVLVVTRYWDETIGASITQLGGEGPK